MREFEESCRHGDRKSAKNLLRSVSKEEIQLLEGESQRKSSFVIMLTVSIIVFFFNMAIFMNEHLLDFVRANHRVFFRGSVDVYHGEREKSMASQGNEISKILLPQLQTTGENELLLTDFMNIISADSSLEAQDNTVVPSESTSEFVNTKLPSDEDFSRKRSEVVGKVEVF